MKKIFIISAAFATLIACKPLDRSIRPVAGAAKEVKLGETQSFTLPNGLKVFVVENHKLPTVAYSLVLNNDPILEGAKSGSIDIAGGLLGTATANRTKDEINESIDFIGARFSASASGFFASSLTKNQDAMLEVVSDVILNPVFKQEEFDKIKTQTLSGLASEKTDPDAITGNVRRKLNFGASHPYGEIVTEKTIENVTLADCKAYYNTFYKPNVGYMAIVGDIDMATAKAKVEKYFGSWEKGEVPSFNYETPEVPAKTAVALVNKPGAVQSVVNVTYPVKLDRKSEDLMAAKVMNQILGGGSAARLFGNLREDKAYTYGAYSSLSNDELIGYFNANAKVRNEVTDSAIVEFLYEINKLINEVPSADEVQGVINNMSGTFAIGLENASTVATYALNIDRYNLPADYYSTYLQRLATVTPEQVNAAAKKYLKPENANILVVGDEELAEKLNAFGEVALLDTEGNVDTGVKPAPEGVTAKSVINQYIEAIGGLKTVNAVKKSHQKYEVSMAGAPAPLDMEMKASKPNNFSMSISMNGMVVQAMEYDGKKGTISGMGQSKDAEGAELEELKNQSVMFPEAKYDELGYKYELLGVAKVEGVELYKMSIQDPSGNETMKFFDPATGYLVRTESSAETPMGLMTTVVMMQDYKKSDFGIVEPTVLVQQMGPQSMKMVLTHSEYK